MSKRPRKKKFTVIDVVRVATKLQEEKDGEIIISDSSATDHREIVSNFPEQYIGQKSEAGSRQKRNEGVWQATLEILGENPKATPKQAWKMLESVDPLEWVFEIEDDLLFPRYEGRDRQRKNPAPIKFNTYRTEYVYKARKELGIAVK